MQPLIRLRLLASQLKQDELQQLLQSVIESFATEQMLSLIFNHFVLRYQQTNEHDNGVSHMIQMISNILNAREKAKTKPKQKRVVSGKTNIDSLPSDMIGECASYLRVSDYISFSKCNRKAYIGCNSPATLQELYLRRASIGCKLNQFPLLSKLKLCSAAFKQYITSHPIQNPLHHLHSLTLHSANAPKLDLLSLSKNLPLQNIRHVSCSHFGLISRDERLERFDIRLRAIRQAAFAGFDLPAGLWYDSASFCELLSCFKQLVSLTFHKVYLSDDFDIQSITNIVPNLRILAVDQVNDSALLLRNKLLKMYSQQMVSVLYDESKMNIGVCCFPKLKAVRSTDPNMDSLLKIIQNTSYLEHFSCAIPMGSLRGFDEKQMKNIIDTLFGKCVGLKEVEMKANRTQIQQIIKWMESALCDANSKIKKQMRLSFLINSDVNEEEINQIMFSVLKLIHAVESTVDDFIVVVVFTSQSPKAIEQNIDAFKNKYLVHTYKDLNAVIISNKTCKINGHRSNCFQCI
eukprot:50525_1